MLKNMVPIKEEEQFYVCELKENS